MQTMSPEALAAQWIAAKNAENEAKDKRLEIERQLIEVVEVKEEGSTTNTLKNGVKVVTKGGYTYKADVQKLLALTASWPEKPVKTKVEADEAFLKAVRHDRPDLWAVIAEAVTLKPAKVYITIEEPTNGL